MQDYSSKYIEQHNSNSFETFLTKTRLERISKFLNNKKPEKILEIGCGLYPIIDYYKYYRLYTVIERSKEFCIRLLEKDTQTNNNHYIKIICGDIEDKETINKMNEIELKYDVIILSSIIHFLKNPEVFLSNIKKLCDKNTYIIVNTPNARSLHTWIGFLMGKIKSIYDLSEMDIEFGQRKKYCITTLCELMSKCGFYEVNSGSYLLKPFSDKQMTKIGLNDKLIEALCNVIGDDNYCSEGCEIYYVGKIR